MRSRFPALVAAGGGLLVCAAALPARADIQPRIVGGVPTTRDKFPWMVALTAAGNTDLFDAQFCGGALIHPQWVVTAAHCVEDETTNSMDVVIGAYNLETDSPASVQRIAIAEIIMHPAYDTESSDSDIALLRLARPVSNPALLPLIDDAALCTPGTDATVIGWGTTSDGGNASPVLREVTIPIVSLATANATPVYAGSLTANMLPAGLAAGGKDACQGDSGGPLIVAGPGGVGSMLAGVVSFGDGCGLPNAYGIYTRVLNYRSWLLAHSLPSYGAWEDATGAIGETRDPDVDGQTNWAEFLRGDPPLDGLRGYSESAGLVLTGGQTFGTFTFRRRTGAEIDTRVFFSGNGLSNWQPINLDTQTIGTPTPVPGATGLEERTIKAPVAAAAGYFRLTGKVSGTSAGSQPGDVPDFVLGVTTGGALQTSDPANPLATGGIHYMDDFLLANATPGQIVTLSLASAAFVPLVDVLDSATGHSVWIGSIEPGKSRVAFYVVPGRTYLVRVSSDGIGSTGSYTLSGSSAAPVTLGQPQSKNGNLSNGDLPDPTYSPALYRKDDYLYTAVSSAAVTLEMTSPVFDCYLSVYDAASGELLDENDDISQGNLDSRIHFTPVAGARYIFRATSANESETGSYTIRTL